MAVAHATPSLRTANQSGPFTFLILTATPTPKQTDRKVKSPQNSDNLNNKEIVPNSYYHHLTPMVLGLTISSQDGCE
jgi:hypothetical protein